MVSSPAPDLETLVPEVKVPKSLQGKSVALQVEKEDNELEIIDNLGFRKRVEQTNHRLEYR